MKVILSVDAIKTPLTGIGRYTLELANRVPVMLGYNSVRFFSGGRWVKNVGLLLNQSSIKLSARQRLLRSSLAVATYRMLSPLLFGQRLKSFSTYLYHSPNFYLPPFGGPSVATIHDLSIYRYPQFQPPERVAFMQKEIPLALSRANYLITDSEFIRQEIITFFGFPEDKVCTVPLGVGREYRPRIEDETIGLLKPISLTFGRYVLCVATIEPRKNIEVLLSAYKALPDELRNRYPLVLAGGDGWRSEKIHQRIELAQRQGWLRYLGYVSEVELPILFSGARAFVYPSLYEGFGLPVLEAMASGLPVLISNRSSLPEVASEAALIVEAGDTQAITENIRLMLEDDQWRKDASKTSLKVAERYSWNKTAKKTIEVYRTVYSEAFGDGVR